MLVPVPIGVPPQEFAYQYIAPPVPELPFAVSVMLVPLQMRSDDAVATVGASGGLFTVTATLAHVV